MAESRGGATLRGAIRDFRLLNLEQRAAAIGAVLLIVSTFGPFSFVEAAEILTALGVLALLRARAQGKQFHLPFGDGTIVAGAGVWAALLVVARLLDRSLGQNLLAIACAAILVAAGVRERAKRPADDLPPERRAPPIRRDPEPGPRPSTPAARPRRARPPSEDVTEPLPPPEFEPGRRAQREEPPDEDDERAPRLFDDQPPGG